MTLVSKYLVFIGCFGLAIILSCNQNYLKKVPTQNTRNIIDTIGFAQYEWQLDSIYARIDKDDLLKTAEFYKTVICPHDDYAYAAGLYTKTLAGIKANTILLIGVAHKAKKYNLADKIIFGSYDSWESSAGRIKVSYLRNDLVNKLPNHMFEVHDSMMQLEHSLEAIIPFLKKQNNKVEIIPILVPYNTYIDLDKISDELSRELSELMIEKKWNYGKDLAIVISNDAIHYGDQDWGGKNLAPFGVDSIGNEKAKNKDLQIIEQCLTGTITKSKIESFNEITINQDNYKEYKWTWCGRYSVPFGLLVANKLHLTLYKKPIQGSLLDYRSSDQGRHLETTSIGMGTTAPANHRHWVAYAGIKYQ